jgi:hypothetical protein
VGNFFGGWWHRCRGTSSTGESLIRQRATAKAIRAKKATAMIVIKTLIFLRLKQSRSQEQSLGCFDCTCDCVASSSILVSLAVAPTSAMPTIVCDFSIILLCSFESELLIYVIVANVA